MKNWEEWNSREKDFRENREKHLKFGTYKTIWNGASFRIIDLKAKLSLELLEKGHKLISLNNDGSVDYHCSLTQAQQLELLRFPWGRVTWEDMFTFDICFIQKDWRYQYTAIENNDQYQEYLVRKYKIEENKNESFI
jgi:hypothetical protein